jgi:hypothetical protein
MSYLLSGDVNRRDPRSHLGGRFVGVCRPVVACGHQSPAGGAALLAEPPGGRSAVLTTR